ncbi:MAG TPA: hypothetical protein VEZ40_03820 [Pyrinomonadaceae bacterium]|nr:hypothetical protein [Pyrinomonadaceae bacterium]
MTAPLKSKIDPKEYERLVSRALPAVIEAEEENERMLAAVERMMRKGEETLTPEESRLFKLMVWLVEDFERRAYPVPEDAPHEVLCHLAAARGRWQSGLLPIFGSRGYASDVMNEKRGISKAKAKELAEFFNVSPELFL